MQTFLDKYSCIGTSHTDVEEQKSRWHMSVRDKGDYVTLQCKLFTTEFEYTVHIH